MYRNMEEEEKHESLLENLLADEHSTPVQKKVVIIDPSEEDEIFTEMGTDDSSTQHVNNGEDEEDGDVTDEIWDEYEPSISDRLQIGYYRMDRACQTSESDLINLKQLSDLLAVTNLDVASLKKNLYYAKLTLQAEYDGRLHDELTAINKGISGKLAEIEAVHHEKINVLRRSYRTQLANALCKLARDYHRYYGQKDADTQASHLDRMNELEKKRLESRKNELMQKELAEMLRLQQEEANKINVEEDLSVVSSVVSMSKYTAEIEVLNTTISDLESKVEYLEELMEETNLDNSQLNAQLEHVTTNLNNEERKTKGLQEEISLLNKKIAKERYAAQERLNEQKEKLKEEMDAKLHATRQKMQEDSAKQMADMKKHENEKLRKQKELDAQRLNELKKQQKEVVVPVQPVVDHNTAELTQRITAQDDEITNLSKELQRKTKLWEMKVKILQEHIHVLKDEMFLRNTLQRQSAKMNQAGLTYAKHGSQQIPLGVNPVDGHNLQQRKHRLPTLIQAPKVSNESVNTPPVNQTTVNQQLLCNSCKD